MYYCIKGVKAQQERLHYPSFCGFSTTFDDGIESGPTFAFRLSSVEQLASNAPDVIRNAVVVVRVQQIA